MTTKAQLRREIAEKRRALDLQWLTQASLRIIKRLQGMDAFKTAKNIALYKAIAGEVDLEFLFPACWELGMHTSIPVFNSALKIYDLAAITATTQYTTGNYGIQEPKNQSLVSIDDMDLILVPGVAFDTAGNRLGRGGGYYDRLLAGFSGNSAAVAFDFQVVTAIPCDRHDIPVHYVVTETKIIKVQNEH